jgi:inosine-uridine nucleoside N-ribohydrolase
VPCLPSPSLPALLARRASHALLLVVAALLLAACGAPPPRLGACVVIDTDYDVDDLMAIPLVVGNRHVAAIVASEGYTLPESAAAAIDHLVNRLPDQPGVRPIPVIVGGKQGAGGREDLSAWPWLPFFRAAMNRSNGLLAEAPPPAPADAEYPSKVAAATSTCSSVSVLIVGTYTSFVRYVDLIRPKIDRVVVMGQRIGDASRTPGRESFNCAYDMPACTQAMGLMDGLDVAFVDIPRNVAPAPMYEPSDAMVDALVDAGLAGALRRALVNDTRCDDLFARYGNGAMPVNPGGAHAACTSRSTWSPAWVHDGPGGEMLLWDQAAALYLLHPELFAPYGPGLHHEPVLLDGSGAATIERLRRTWTEDTNRAASAER